MPVALFEALLLAISVLAIRLLPAWAVVVVFLLPLIAYGLLANRTRPHRFRGSKVLVTGASSGLGKALAGEAAARGARQVLMVARTRDTLEAAAHELGAAWPHTEFLPFVADVTDPASVQAMADEVLASRGTPNVLINNAGVGAWHHVEEDDAGDIQTHTACPYMGAAWVTRAFAPSMVERGSGHVVNVTSAASIAAFRGAVTYGASRWAVRGYSRYLRADLSDRGVGVTLLNAAEIEDTAYFSDAPGKAGAISRSRIPALFQLGVVRWASYDAAATARAGLDAVERGTHEALVPIGLVTPVRLLAGALPDAVDGLLAMGSAARR